METTTRERAVTSGPLRRAALMGARWAMLTLAALALALLWMSRALRPTGQHLFDLGLALVPGAILSLAAGALAWWLMESTRGGVRLKLAIPALLAALVMTLNVWIAAQQMFLVGIDAQMLIGFLIFGTGVAVTLAWSLATSLAGGLQRLAEGARRVAGGDYQARIPEHASSLTEIDGLARSFNQMAASVQLAFTQRLAAETQRRQLLAALSHDVRTPLAAMRAMLEAIDDGVVVDRATVQRYHTTIREEMHHLSALLDDLFEVANMEAGTLALQREPLNVIDLLSDALEAAHEQAERSGITLVGDVGTDLPMIIGDARQIYRVIRNLLTNALRHTPSGGVIIVRVAMEEALIQVQVIDNGEGIAARDLPHIFEPAYRGERSRRRDSISGGGTGLGLAIVRGVVQAHGGAITAISPLPPDVMKVIGIGMTPNPSIRAGTCMTMWFPAERRTALLGESVATPSKTAADHREGGW